MAQARLVIGTLFSNELFYAIFYNFKIGVLFLSAASLDDGSILTGRSAHVNFCVYGGPTVCCVFILSKGGGLIM